MMSIKSVVLLSDSQKDRILQIWNNVYPVSLNYKIMLDFENYLVALGDLHFLLLLDENNIVQGCYFDFIRNNERFFAMMIDEHYNKKGFGFKLLTKAKEQNTKLNGWVIEHDNDLLSNGSRYQSPLKFYLKNGFKIIPTIKLELENLSAIKIEWTK